jgi:RNA 2',3'-cyclic 3'-phosphodiesterase
MTTRLFVAIELGAAVLEEASRLLGELRRRVDRRYPSSRITWVAPDRLHLTVRFIGHVNEPEGSRIAEALKPSLSGSGFDVEWRGLGAFPKSGPPRVLWVGATTGHDRLLALEQEVSKRLTEIGVAREARAYSPHLTLARVREARGLRTAALFERLVDRRLGTTRVDEITLFESRLSPKGPTYVALQFTKLEPR